MIPRPKIVNNRSSVLGSQNRPSTTRVTSATTDPALQCSGTSHPMFQPQIYLSAQSTGVKYLSTFCPPQCPSMAGKGPPSTPCVSLLTWENWPHYLFLSHEGYLHCGVHFGLPCPRAFQKHWANLSRTIEIKWWNIAERPQPKGPTENCKNVALLCSCTITPFISDGTTLN